MPKINITSLRIAMNEILMKSGVSSDFSEIITDTALYANVRGIHTHGVGRIPLYINKIKANKINVNAPIIINDDKCTAVYDAENGFGQVVSSIAMSSCIAKAKEYGVGVVGVRNSNNFGTAAYYAEMATQEGMLAIVMANSSPATAPTGGNIPILGTNPICFAVPGNNEDTPIILDMATTVVARGKIRLAAKQGVEIPDNWAIDENGNPTTDPNVALKGSLLPIGGYKGYGLSLFVDIIAGLVMGSSFAGDVKPLSNFDEASGNGHAFIVIDLQHFICKEDYQTRIDYLSNVVKSTGENVILPGENWFELSVENKYEINIPQVQIDEINAILAEHQLNEL